MNKLEWRAAGLVAATYVYFLIFAEFAFIELARPVTGDGPHLRAVMGALGAGGVLGSLAAARFFSPANWGRGLARWFFACAAAALVALGAAGGGVPGLALTALLVGLSLGGATVWLATGLRAMAGARRLGLAAGAGTGSAYALCNVPAVFESSPAVQTAIAAGVALLGAAFAWRSPLAPAHVTPADAPVAWRATARAVAPWLVVLLALVWMDSAAFYIIQHTQTLKSAAWGGAWTLWGNAATHLVAACVAGIALDRGRTGWVTGAAALALAGACHWISTTGAQVAYVAGVSLYSVALVQVPARLASPWAAAAVFALAGWVGSALGIGMAQDLHTVPDWFAAAVLSVVAAALVWRRRLGPTAVLASVVAGALLAPAQTRADETEAAVFRGREVYVAEGCIHCHSQYVRPGTDDVVRWGPVRPLAELLAERPPLPGNRRQGPDLLNVGNRRTPEWNRLHLIAPREISPGSRMPSYARLFAPGERRGEDLIAYLASRGADTESARGELTTSWRPSSEARADPELGARWFVRACVQCHGPKGRGDGPLAPKLSPPPADLTRAEMDRDEERLARLIKFGRPGTSMAGHEALADDAVVSLARHVATLQGAGSTR